MRRCTKCGYENDDGDKKCIACGAILIDNVTESYTQFNGPNGANHSSSISDRFPLKYEKFLNSDQLYQCGIKSEKGIGVEKNKEEALEIYKVLAERGDPRGMYSLACMYLEIGNKGDAEKWLQMAAKDGHLPSRIKLQEINPDALKQDVSSTNNLNNLNVEKTMKSVVKICSSHIENDGYYLSQGAGFILNGGYVITNAHVVGNNYNSITATFEQRLDNEIYELEPVSVQPDADIAILKFIGLAKDKISARENLSLKEGDLNYGQFVYTIGNPHGIGISVSSGIVSCPNRSYNYLPKVKEFIQTDISINHGNSGGALFDEHDNVVGMITSTHGNVEWGLSMAIPAKYIRNELEKIKT
jgi:serine protease Do